MHTSKIPLTENEILVLEEIAANGGRMLMRDILSVPRPSKGGVIRDLGYKDQIYCGGGRGKKRWIATEPQTAVQIELDETSAEDSDDE